MRALPIERSVVFNYSTLFVTLLGSALLGLAWLLRPQWLLPLLGIGMLVYLGVMLPLLIGRRERAHNARLAQQASIAKWGFASRDRAGPWLNYIDHPLAQHDPLFAGRYFYSEWLVIHDGLLLINPGRACVDLARGEVRYAFDQPHTYAWDGCTPKISFFWLALFGTPDWWDSRTTLQVLEQDRLQSKAVLWPLAHHASLVHDALYQYLNVAPVSKAEADRLFHHMLREAGMAAPLAFIYYLAVSLGGAPRMRGVRNGNNTLRSLTPMPSQSAADDVDPAVDGAACSSR